MNLINEFFYHEHEEIIESLGRVNYIVNSLMKSGYIKARRFKNSKNRTAYMYILTPKGVTNRVENAKKTFKAENLETAAATARIHQRNATLVVRKKEGRSATTVKTEGFESTAQVFFSFTAQPRWAGFLRFKAISVQ